MNNLQLATTYTSPTGTGRLYTAYGQGLDENVWDYKATDILSLYRVRRTQPKPVPGSPGVERINAKLTETLTVSGVVQSPMIIEVVTSMPTVLSQAQKAACSLNALFLYALFLDNAIATGRLST